MSRRPQISRYPVISNGNMGGSLTSAVTVIQDLTMISYGLSWTGSTPVGSVSVQVSNDYALNSDGSVKNAGTWNTMTVSLAGIAVTVVPITGNTGNGFIDIDASAAYAMRLIYTRASGTGTLQCILNAKVM